MRITSRHTDLGCLFVAISLVISSTILGYILLKISEDWKQSINPSIEKLSQETDKVLEKAIVNTSQETEKVLEKAIADTSKETEKVLEKTIINTSQEAKELVTKAAEEVPHIVVNSVKRIHDPEGTDTTSMNMGDMPVYGPYSVKKGDQVFFRIRMTDSNPIANPCFYLYRLEDEKLKKIDKTGYIEGSRLKSAKVSSPSVLSWSISEKDLQNTIRYRISVKTIRTGKNWWIVNGISCPATKLKAWLKRKPKDLLTLDIANGSSVTLRYDRKKGNDYIVQIVKYNISEKSVEKTILPELIKNTEYYVLDSSNHIVPRQKDGSYLLKSYALYSVKTNEGKYSRTVQINGLFERLQNRFENSTTSRQVPFLFDYPNSGIKLNLTFEGIHRTYMVDRVDVPEDTDFRMIPVVKFWFNGGIRRPPVSQLRVIIYQDGKQLFSTDAEYPSWNPDFSKNKNNRFSIREGLPHRYMVQIIHKNMGQPITELTKLTDLNFHANIAEKRDQKVWQLLLPGTISIDFKRIE